MQALSELLILALHGRAWVRPQMSFAAHELSEPEPDLAIAPRADYVWLTTAGRQLRMYARLAG